MRTTRRRAVITLTAASLLATFIPAHNASAATSPAVGLAAVYNTITGKTNGYWIALADGTVVAKGLAPSLLGDMSGKPLNFPIVDIASTPTGRGYWLVASDGGVFAFGDAQFYGSAGALKLNKGILAIASTKTGKGYWLGAADGGVFAYGDAAFYGSMGGKPLNKPVVDFVAAPSGTGYYMVGADGGVFNFGPGASVSFSRSGFDTGSTAPFSAMAVTTRGTGVRLVQSDGTLANSGLAIPTVTDNTTKPNTAVVDIAPNPEPDATSGYYYLLADGGVFNYGVPFFGSAA